MKKLKAKNKQIKLTKKQKQLAINMANMNGTSVKLAEAVLRRRIARTGKAAVNHGSVKKAQGYFLTIEE